MALGKSFTECIWAFAECRKHSTNHQYPVVVPAELACDHKEIKYNQKLSHLSWWSTILFLFGCISMHAAACTRTRTYGNNICTYGYIYCNRSVDELYSCRFVARYVRGVMRALSGVFMCLTNPSTSVRSTRRAPVAAAAGTSHWNARTSAASKSLT